MSRIVRRVPLDFDHPLNQVWPGFVSPAVPECRLCQGRGQTPARAWLESITMLILAAGEHGATGGHLHPYLANLMNRPDTRPPSRDMAELSTGLAGRAPVMRWHDAIDRWRATKAIIRAAGLDPETWGVCPQCKGEGTEGTPEQLAAHAAWEPTDPPSGEGWQLWESVSEGSPITPVFASAEQLVDYLVSDAGYRRSAAEQVISDGGTAFSFARFDGSLLDAAKDADIIAAKKNATTEACGHDGCPARAWRNGYCGPHQTDLPEGQRGAYT